MLNSRFLYIHIPFCDVICHYCHFYTARGMEAGDQESFFQALEKHLDLEEANLAPQLSGIYFGGGTPSASPPHLIAGFLKKLEKRIHAETEITLEANPTRVSS